jgi:hypothetical protein
MSYMGYTSYMGYMGYMVTWVTKVHEAGTPLITAPTLNLTSM